MSQPDNPDVPATRDVQAARARTEPKHTVLVLDVGGSHVKCIATGHKKSVKFESGPKMTPQEMVAQVQEITEGWHYDAVSIGYPGAIRSGQIVLDPHNLGDGWVGFDFQSAFKRPLRLINDAAMQALGAYRGGTMLFLGLGTGLGSALIADGVIVALELAHLPGPDGRSYEKHLGEKMRKKHGNKKWRHQVADVVELFRKAFLPDEIVLGGGNARHLKTLPPQTRHGDNADAFLGGFRLWEQPHSPR